MSIEVQVRQEVNLDQLPVTQHRNRVPVPGAIRDLHHRAALVQEDLRAAAAVQEEVAEALEGEDDNLLLYSFLIL